MLIGSQCWHACMGVQMPIQISIHTAEHQAMRVPLAASSHAQPFAWFPCICRVHALPLTALLLAAPRVLMEKVGPVWVSISGEACRVLTPALSIQDGNACVAPCCFLHHPPQEGEEKLAEMALKYLVLLIPNVWLDCVGR
jgi:hypothetical protein